jgi:hypothetical protein
MATETNELLVEPRPPPVQPVVRMAVGHHVAKHVVERGDDEV